MIHAAGFGTAALKPTALGRWHPAVRLGGLVLGLVTGLACGWAGAVLLAAAASVALVRSGLPVTEQVDLLKPWWPLAALVVGVHTLTATGVAPLGHPSWQGALTGGLALLRLTGALLALGLFLRITGMDDMVGGLQWWLRPLEGLGVPVEDLGLVLAVALGTAPVVVSEGRRLRAVIHLRRTGPVGSEGRRRRFAPWRPLTGRVALVLPLLEGLARRTDAVSLSLRRRRPTAAGMAPGVPVGQALVLVVWLVCLTAWVIGKPAGRSW